MTEDYREGFDDAIKQMFQFLEKIELKNKQCIKLSILMNLMANWKNCLTVQENINYTKDILDKVKNEYFLFKRYRL